MGGKEKYFATQIKIMENNSQIIIFTTEKGETKLQVRLENETVWLTQKLMAQLFQTTIANINIHLKNIFDEGELVVDSVIKDYLITAADGTQYISHPKYTWFKLREENPGLYESYNRPGGSRMDAS